MVIIVVAVITSRSCCLLYLQAYEALLEHWAWLQKHWQKQLTLSQNHHDSLSSLLLLSLPLSSLPALAAPSASLHNDKDNNLVILILSSNTQYHFIDFFLSVFASTSHAMPGKPALLNMHWTSQEMNAALVPSCHHCCVVGTVSSWLLHCFQLMLLICLCYCHLLLTLSPLLCHNGDANMLTSISCLVALLLVDWHLSSQCPCWCQLLVYCAAI